MKTLVVCGTILFLGCTSSLAVAAESSRQDVKAGDATPSVPQIPPVNVMGSQMGPRVSAQLYVDVPSGSGDEGMMRAQLALMAGANNYCASLIKLGAASCSVQALSISNIPQGTAGSSKLVGNLNAIVSLPVSWSDPKIKVTLVQPAGEAPLRR